MKFWDTSDSAQGLFLVLSLGMSLGSAWIICGARDFNYGRQDARQTPYPLYCSPAPR